MARGGCGIEAGRVYHVIPRFVAKEWFIESELERNCYLSLLGGAIAETDWELFAYAIMSSHVHLGVRAGDVPLADWMRPMHTRFANWMNVHRERIGAVFVRGPNVVEIRPDGAAKLIDYIHRNPERAGIATESTWTSQRAYVGRGHQPRWLDVECGLELAGMSREEFRVWTDDARTDAKALELIRAEPIQRRGRPHSEKAKTLGVTKGSLRSGGRI
jgi:putative transposase